MDDEAVHTYVMASAQVAAGADMVSIGFGVLAALSLIVAAMNCLLGGRIKFPEPPGANHISEGPYSKASRQRGTYKGRAVWALIVGMLSLAISLTMLGGARPTAPRIVCPGAHGPKYAD
jgi:hypothetical protein